jgi:hypothetical protein
LAGLRGSSESYLRCFAMSTDIRSAADMEEVGWPDPARVVARMLSTRSCWASSRQKVVESPSGAVVIALRAQPLSVACSCARQRVCQFPSAARAPRAAA